MSVLRVGTVGALLLLATHGAWAAPSLSVTPIGPDPSGDFHWRVAVIPDASLFSQTNEGLGGSIAVEFGFTVTGSTLVGVDANDSAWPYHTPGNNPFTGTVTQGIVVDGQEMFVSLGSDLFFDEQPVELVTVRTQGFAPTTVSWGGQSLLEDTPLAFVGGRLAQAAQNFDGIIGNASVLFGDYDSDGLVDSTDLTFLLLAWTGSDNPSPAVEWPNGDMDGNLTVDSAELTILLLNWTGAQASLTGLPHEAMGDPSSLAEWNPVVAMGGSGSAWEMPVSAIPEPAGSYAVVWGTMLGVLYSLRWRRSVRQNR